MYKHLPARKGWSRTLMVHSYEEKRKFKWWYGAASLEHRNHATATKEFPPVKPFRYSERRLEWHLFRKITREFPFGFGLGFDILFGGEHGLKLSLYLGPLASFWLTLDGTRVSKIFGARKGKPYPYEGREYGFTLWPYQGEYFRLTCGILENTWGPDTTGFRISSGDIARKIFGSVRYEVALVEGPLLVLIELPEGVYQGVAKKESYTRTYTKPLGRLRTKIKKLPYNERWDVDVPGGIPIEGKGENSWDCGMNGLFSQSGPAKTFDEAVDGVIKSVLHDRARYGGPDNLPHPMTVKEAEKWVKENG